jgi:hypothetical protein
MTCCKPVYLPACPQTQPVGYLGNAFSCQPVVLPPPECDSDLGVYGALVLSQVQYASTLETPLLIRYVYLFTAAMSNALTGERQVRCAAPATTLHVC